MKIIRQALTYLTALTAACRLPGQSWKLHSNGLPWKASVTSVAGLINPVNHTLRGKFKPNPQTLPVILNTLFDQAKQSAGMKLLTKTVAEMNFKPHPAVAPGLFVILSGPSGVGKGTIKQHLVETGQFQLIPNLTTRQQRSNEINGREYFFLGNEEFKVMVDLGMMAEWVHLGQMNAYYGTFQPLIEGTLYQGKNIVTDIETEGKKHLEEKLRGTPLAARLRTIFILPPGADQEKQKAVLRERLMKRGTENLSALESRLQQAQQQLAAAHTYDFQVVNDDFHSTIATIQNYLAHYTKPAS